MSNQGLGVGSAISYTAVNGYFKYLSTANVKTGTVFAEKIVNPEFNCMKNVINSMFDLSGNDVSGCYVSGLTNEFKDLICDTVYNHCVYCNCGVVRGIQEGTFDAFNFEENNQKNLNLTKNNVWKQNLNSDTTDSFFHEEIINEDNLLNEDLEILETDNLSDSSQMKQIEQMTTYSKFIAKNLNIDVMCADNNLKLISIDKISKGTWLFNGNITLEIPKDISISNLKLFVYLNENVVQAGEVDLGSHQITYTDITKSCPFNLMFKNDIDGAELKIGLISLNNDLEIKLLKTTNFFANKM